MNRILVVCMGNICRSPMAEAVGTHLANLHGLQNQFHFESAGTHAMVANRQPDQRARLALERGGYDISKRRPRALVKEDFERFDLILGMDRQNLADMKFMASAEQWERLHLFLDFTPDLAKQEVPDPYFGDSRGFEHVLALCEAGVHGLLGLAYGVSGK